MKDIFLLISIVLSVWGFLWGIRTILKGYFKPQRMTRFLFMLIFVLIFIFLFMEKDTNSIYVAFMAAFGSVVIFLLSLKKGMGGRSKFDLVVLAVALISIGMWVLIGSSLIGLITSILAGTMAYIPTYIKSWKNPGTEDWFFYLIYALASVFSILSIKDFSVAKMVFPIFLALSNGTLIFIIVLRKNLLRK